MRFDYEHLGRTEANCWLLANGLGGYAGTSGIFSVTRRDQGLLIGARSPSLRRNLVHRLSEALEAAGRAVFLSSQTFAEGRDEDGWRWLTRFSWDDGPVWEYDWEGVHVLRRCAVVHGENTAAVTYVLRNDSDRPCRLSVRPVLPVEGEALPTWTGEALELGDWKLYVRANCPIRPFPQSPRTSITPTTPRMAARPGGWEKAASGRPLRCPLGRRGGWSWSSPRPPSVKAGWRSSRPAGPVCGA